MTDDDRTQNMEAILRSPSYRLVEDDAEFMKQPELRPIRLQLELLKPELTLAAQKVRSTIVVFGGTQIVPREAAELRLAAARSALDAMPGDPFRARAVSRTGQPARKVPLL